MEIIIKLFYSILFISWGFYLVRYRRLVKWWTWNFYWAEKYLWSGWTYLVLVLTWLAMIFYGFVYPFWWFELIAWVKK